MIVVDSVVVVMIDVIDLVAVVAVDCSQVIGRCAVEVVLGVHR